MLYNYVNFCVFVPSKYFKLYYFINNKFFSKSNILIEETFPLLKPYS